jgi:hypothetical protein
VTNPAPWPLPDGRVVLALSGDNGAAGKCLGVAVAATWNGTYENEDAAIRGGEDPFLWVTPRGDRQMVWHDVSGTSNGGHAFAPAAAPQQWTVGTHALYTGAVRWANGTAAVVADRERPKLVFDRNGAPIALINGLMPHSDGRSFTAVTHVGAGSTRLE